MGLVSIEAVEESLPVARSAVFRRLADRHLESSYRLAYVILGERAAAEDATHDAFVTAWRKWSSLRDPAKFEHWFERILINTCRNYLRTKSRHVIRDISSEMRIDDADPNGAAEDRDVLEPALKRLSHDHRLVIALRYYHDLTVDEIADRLGIPAGTVKSRLHNALRMMHAALDEAAAKELLR